MQLVHKRVSQSGMANITIVYTIRMMVTVHLVTIGIYFQSIMQVEELNVDVIFPYPIVHDVSSYRRHLIF